MTTSPKPRCPQCGGTLPKAASFCPHCGARTVRTPPDRCPCCGEEIRRGRLCLHCGYMLTTPCPVCHTDLGGNEHFCPNCGEVVSTYALLCAQGNYAKAYKIARADEKLTIRAENAAAVHSAIAADNLEDPNSFALKEAYYQEIQVDGKTSKYLVLYIRGANRHGARVSSHRLYTWDNQAGEWSDYCAVSDLNDEKVTSYEDDERPEKSLNNLGRLIIKTTMRDGIKLSKDAVKRINALFAAGTLDNVELLEVE